MRFEAVIAEVQGKQSSWRAKGSVGAAPVGCWNKNASFRGSRGDGLLKFPGIYERNVARNHQRALSASSHANRCRHGNGVCFASIVVIGNNPELVLLSELARERITGYDRDLRSVFP